MALPSILHHFDVALSHVDRGLERALAVKVARHPSETAARLWLRLLAWCLLWEETLTFGPGLCEPDDPDLFALAADGTTRSLLVRVGRPDLARVERDLSRASGARVAVVFEAERRLQELAAEAQAGGRPERLRRAELLALPESVLRPLAGREERRVRLGLTIVADHLYLDLGGETLEGPLSRWTP